MTDCGCRKGRPCADHVAQPWRPGQLYNPEPIFDGEPEIGATVWTRLCWWLSRRLGGRSVFGKWDLS